MNSQTIGPITKGQIIKTSKNVNNTYDGIVQTSNKNKYYYFNIEKQFNINDVCVFNIATTLRNDCDFEALNVQSYYNL